MLESSAKIYVGGKYYRESDLLTMIDYYNARSINIQSVDLPRELMAEILKHHACYPSISKLYYYPKLFYDQYHDLPPVIHEVIQYIEDDHPEIVNMITEFDDRIWNLSIRNDQFTNAVITVVREKCTSKMKIPCDNSSFNFVKQMMKVGMFRTLQCDVHTAYKIYGKRINCVSYNPNYAVEMTRRYIDYLVSQIPNQFNDMIAIYQYAHTYMLILQSVGEFIPELFIVALNNVKMNDYENFLIKYPLKPWIEILRDVDFTQSIKVESTSYSIDVFQMFRDALENASRDHLLNVNI
jgi:hypothetical protein